MRAMGCQGHCDGSVRAQSAPPAAGAPLKGGSRRRFVFASRGDGVTRDAPTCSTERDLESRSRRPFLLASRGDGIALGAWVCSRQRGFTLIEVLLATVLLASGLALAFATLRAATGTAQRGEALAQRNEQMRAVEGFLRKRIGGALPLPFAQDPSTGEPRRFAGDESSLRFVADVPDYLGFGGPYLHEFSVEDGGDGVRLTLALSMVQAGVPVEAEPRPPEVLLEGMQEVRFRYRALLEDGSLGEWQPGWTEAGQLPLQVHVSVRDGEGRDWPGMVVALPLAHRDASRGGLFR